MSPALPAARPIDPGLPLGEELRRVLRDELRLVIDACVTYPSWQLRERGVAVRRGQESLKRMGSVLELVRGGLDEKVHEVIRAEARNLEGRLDPLRNRDVVRALMLRLEEEASGKRQREEIRLANVILGASQPELVVRDHRAEESLVSVIGEDAEVLLDRIERVDVSDLDRALVLDRFQGLWRRARNRFQVAFDAPDTDWLHETRSRVVRLQLGIQPLVTIRPGPLQKSVKNLKRVADPLGEDHDLAMLGGLIATHVTGPGDDRTISMIGNEVGRRRKRLQKKASRRGTMALRGRPRDARNRLEHWWERT